MKFAWLLILLMFPLPALAWTSDSRVSPVDDSEIPIVWVDAKTEYSDRNGRSGRATLILQCEQNTTLLAIVLPELYTSDNGGLGTATFRVDSKVAAERHMTASNDHGNLALFGGDAIRAIRDMFGGTELFVRVLTVNEPAKDIWFDIEGTEQAVAPLRESCGW